MDKRLKRYSTDAAYQADKPNLNYPTVSYVDETQKVYYISQNPVNPDEPIESIGSITDDNSIVIDETKLEKGTYTLRYIDTNENIIDNFNEITSFEINK